MCLRPVHFLLPVVPVVPGGGAAAGQGTGNGPVPPPGRQAVRRLRGAVHARLQPGQILPGMCAESPPAAKGRVRAPEKGTAWTIRGQKTLVNQGFFRGCRWGPDRFILWPPKRPSKGVQTPEITPKEEPMSDNRKYYYLKLKENFYNSETMVILESMQDGLLYSNLLLKMYLMSLKSGGILMLNDRLPHTPQTIATFTRHQVGTVERALKVFLEFGLVEILTDGAYYMADIQLLIGQSSTEGERKKKERMRLKRQKLLPSGGADICPPYSRGDICPPENRDKRLDIRDKSIENRESESARAYGRYQNVFLTDEELADLQASFPTVWGQYIEKLSEYIASTGKRYQSHAATIRRWASEDARKAAPPTRNRDYSVKEDETV